MKIWMPFIIFCVVFSICVIVAAVWSFPTALNGSTEATSPKHADLWGHGARGLSKFTVHLGAGDGVREQAIDTDKLIFTQAGDWLIQDKRTEKWTLIKGDARVIVNDPTALKLIYARHQQGHKILNQKRNKI